MRRRRFSILLARVNPIRLQDTSTIDCQSARRSMAATYFAASTPGGASTRASSSSRRCTRPVVCSKTAHALLDLGFRNSVGLRWSIPELRSPKIRASARVPTWLRSQASQLTASSALIAPSVRVHASGMTSRSQTSCFSGSIQFSAAAAKSKSGAHIAPGAAVGNDVRVGRFSVVGTRRRGDQGCPRLYDRGRQSGPGSARDRATYSTAVVFQPVSPAFSAKALGLVFPCYLD